MYRVGKKNPITFEFRIISLAKVLEVLKEYFIYGYNIADEETDMSLEKIITYGVQLMLFDVKLSRHAGSLAKIWQ